ncbi:MAG: oligosaccharide flippase family protein [Deltaproteobacteria bacterium]|nr:oligosaccharide flippase family protein [Deltaproteobacteria bacterium]
MIRSFLHAIRQNGFIANISKLMSGTVIAQAIGLLITPILTRIYAADAFGEAALFMSISSIIGVVVCLKYELAIVIPKEDDEAAALFGVSFFAVMFVSLIVAAVTLPGKTLVVDLFKQPSFSAHVVWLPFMIFLLGINLILNYWNSRRNAFGRNAVARVAMSITTQGTKLGGGIFGPASGGLLIGAQIFGQFVSSLMQIFLAWRDKTIIINNNLSLAAMKQAALKYRKFPIYSSWTGLLNTASQQMPVLVMSFFFESSIIGYYALGVGILSLPMSLIAASVSQVFYQKACTIRANKGKEISSKIYINLFALGFLPFAFITLYGRELFTVVFGAQWEIAGSYAQMLSIWTLFMFMARPLSMIISVYELQKIGLVLQINLFVLRIGGVVIGGVVGSPYLAVILFSITGAVHCFLASLWYIHVAGGSVLNVLKESTYIAACGIALLGAHYLLYQNLLKNFIWFVVLSIIIAIFYYLAIRKKIVLYNV